MIRLFCDICYKEIPRPDEEICQSLVLRFGFQHITGSASHSDNPQSWDMRKQHVCNACGDHLREGLKVLFEERKP